MATPLTSRSDRLRKLVSAYVQPGTLVRATITGQLPGFLMHNGAAQQLTADAANEAKANGLRGKFIPDAEQEASWGAYMTGDGALYLPSKNLLRTLVEAGKAFKMEKSRASMKNSVASGVSVPLSVGLGFLLLDPETGDVLREYEIDTQRAVVNRASVFRSRPLVPSWACEIELLCDEQTVQAEMLAQLLAHAGARVGVGDMRPERGGSYGRFVVSAIAIADESAEAAA